MSIRTFAAGRFDLTRGQWAAFVEATNRRVPDGCAVPRPEGYGFDPAASWRNVRFAQDDSHPVVCVTWADAQDYVRWLSQKTGAAYRLLTNVMGMARHDDSISMGDEREPRIRQLWRRGAFQGPCNGPRQVGVHVASRIVSAEHVRSVRHAGQRVAMGAGLLRELCGPGPMSAAYNSIRLTEGMFPFMAGTESCAYRMARGGDWADPRG